MLTDSIGFGARPVEWRLVDKCGSHADGRLPQKHAPDIDRLHPVAVRLHRFYYGKKITGTIWFFTLGLLGIGWLIDVFLIPSMERQAELRYQPGTLDYTLAWILLTFLGLFGVHRFYMGKFVTGIIYFFTGGLFLLGLLYDLWTLNDQVDEINRRSMLT